MHLMRLGAEDIYTRAEEPRAPGGANLVLAVKRGEDGPLHPGLAGHVSWLGGAAVLGAGWEEPRSLC